MNLKDFDESLVGYWDMESTTDDGKLKDLSGNGNHGSFTWGMTYETALTGWINGQWLNFTGWFISYGDVLRLKDEITISVNIIPNYDSIPLSATNLSILWKYGAHNPNDLWYNINLNRGIDSSYRTLSAGGLTGWWNAHTQTHINNKQEYNIVVTSDGKIWKYYLNWVFISSWNNTDRYIVSDASTTEFRIGSVVRWWTNFNWIIDDIKVYNRTLSDEEVLGQAKAAWF